jgi:Na+:H+ antiporter, NhaC family
MASVMGLSEATAAGAVIRGAYFGDKMTPLWETASSCRGRWAI